MEMGLVMDTPFTHAYKDWDQRLPQISQGVFHLWRHLPVDFTVNEAVRFKFTQLPAQHPLGHALQLPSELAKA